MGIECEEQAIVVTGRIGAEDAEQLMALLREHPELPVDLQGCEHLHAAALQVMMALHPPVASSSPDAWLNRALGVGDAEKSSAIQEGEEGEEGEQESTE